MAVYLDSKAISPENVQDWLDTSQVDDDYRFNLQAEQKDYQIDRYGIIRDHGKFYGNHWVVVENWYASLDGSYGKLVTYGEEQGYTFSLIQLEQWEAHALKGVDELAIAVYEDDQGFVDYYTEGTTEQLKEELNTEYGHLDQPDANTVDEYILNFLGACVHASLEEIKQDYINQYPNAEDVDEIILFSINGLLERNKIEKYNFDDEETLYELA